MTIEISELSSLSSLLETLTKRVSAMAEDAASSKDDETAGELFAIERALLGAHRRFERLLSSRDNRRRRSAGS